jgi:hypothetical protein
MGRTRRVATAVRIHETRLSVPPVCHGLQLRVLVPYLAIAAVVPCLKTCPRPARYDPPSSSYPPTDPSFYLRAVAPPFDGALMGGGKMGIRTADDCPAVLAAVRDVAARFCDSWSSEVERRGPILPRASCMAAARSRATSTPH